LQPPQFGLVGAVRRAAGGRGLAGHLRPGGGALAGLVGAAIGRTHARHAGRGGLAWAEQSIQHAQVQQRAARLPGRAWRFGLTPAVEVKDRQIQVYASVCLLRRHSRPRRPAAGVRGRSVLNLALIQQTV
jgi:hypothetical protein